MELKNVFAKAGADSGEEAGLVAKALDGIVSMQKSAIAANHASDMLDEKKTGIISKTVDFVTDTAGDVANIATFGVSRRVTNAVTGVVGKEDKHLDYKALKSAKKEAKAEGSTMTIKERAQALAGFAQVDEQDEAENEEMEP